MEDRRELENYFARASKDRIIAAVAEAAAAVDTEAAVVEAAAAAAEVAAAVVIIKIINSYSHHQYSNPFQNLERIFFVGF